MNLKFCTACQQRKNELKGIYVWRGNIRRWMCDDCIKQRSESFINRERVKLREVPQE